MLNEKSISAVFLLLFFFFFASFFWVKNEKFFLTRKLNFRVEHKIQKRNNRKCIREQTSTLQRRYATLKRLFLFDFKTSIRDAKTALSICDVTPTHSTWTSSFWLFSPFRWWSRPKSTSWSSQWTWPPTSTRKVSLYRSIKAIFVYGLFGFNGPLVISKDHYIIRIINYNRSILYKVIFIIQR